jgi:hypothetical protein
VLQKQDHHTRKRTLPVLLRNTTYNTSKLSFLMTLSVLIYIITDREIVGEDHTGIGVEGTAPCVEEVIT